MPRKLALVGQRFGLWTVIEEAPLKPPSRSSRWKVRCDCGVESVVIGGVLRAGKTKSCGCKKSSVARLPSPTLDGVRHLTCSRCKQLKPETRFRDRPDRPRGKDYVCHDCRADEARRRYQSNPGLRAAIMRNWRTRNRDRSLANQKAWRAANPEREKARKLAYRDRHKERVPHLQYWNRQSSKAKWDEFLAPFKRLPCADCGGSFPDCAMDFDHRNPDEKSFAISHKRSLAHREDVIAEIAKCDVVCSNCHRVRTRLRAMLKYKPHEEVLLRKKR
jgi:hypothetical protein